MSACNHSSSKKSAYTRSDACRCKARRLPRRGVSGFARVPGLFRRWEIEDLLAVGDEIHVEPGGAMDDGTPLHVVFRREGSGP